MLKLRNKFDAQQEISEKPTSNNEYKYFVITHLNRQQNGHKLKS